MLTICEIREEDRTVLREMAEAYWREIFPRSPVVQDPAYRDRYFAGRFRRPSDGASQWWAKAGEKIVGFANVELAKNDVGDVYGIVKDFYIRPDRRHRGQGRAFAELLFRWLHERGARHISLRARVDSQAAVAFWRSIGCEPLHYEMRKYFE